MQLLINGQVQEVAEACTVQELLVNLGYEPQAIAIAKDGQFIPRHLYTKERLAPNQALEIVAPMQGG